MTDDRLRERLRSVDDPKLGVDIVSLGLVTDVHVEAGVAVVSLAFNAPLSPAEWTMCDEIRALCRGVGLEPRIYADTDDERGLFPGVKNTIAIGTTDSDAGTALVTANLATSLASLGARVGVLDCRVDADKRTWIETADPPDISADPIVPPTAREIPVVRLGPAIPDGDDPPSVETVLELLLPTVLEALEWGPLDYLLVVLPRGTGRIPRIVVEEVPIGGTIAVTPADTEPAAVRTMVQAFDTLETSMLGVLGTIDEGAGEADWRATGREWQSSRPGPGCPILGTVPCDRSTLATSPDAARSVGPDVARVGGDDGAPFRQLAVSVADRIGALNRESVAQRQLA